MSEGSSKDTGRTAVCSTLPKLEFQKLSDNTSSGKSETSRFIDLEKGLQAVDSSQEDAELDELLRELRDNDQEPEVIVNVAEKHDPTVIPDEMLQTDEKLGLTTIEVSNRRRKYGLNKMKEEKENAIMKFLCYFVGPIQFVMEAAMVISAGLQHWVDLGVIAGLLLLNACVGFYQDYSAGNIVKSLKDRLALRANILRNGEEVEIDASDVVPGDLVKLEEGVIAPADGRIITKNIALQVDQSSITGESLPATKRYLDTCFSSSTVKRGEAYMVVSATGDNTSVGRAAALVNASSMGSGHFKEVLNRIGSILLAMVAFTLIVVLISCFYRSIDLIRILRFCLGILVVGVPVGLPAVVTTTMAVGASFLAKREAIVQKLSAIESLAGAEILCSDKTGTLTKNKLSMHDPYLIGGTTANDMVLVACLAAPRKKGGIEPIDKVFLQSLEHYKQARSQLCKFTIIDFQPFDPVSKRVTAVAQLPSGERITCVKGEPTTVCRFVHEQSGVPENITNEWKDKVTEFANRGFRSIGIACQKGSEQWQLLGIMPLHDPPRYDTAETINEAKALGLSIKMLTGDHRSIAIETSRQLGLGMNILHADQLARIKLETMTGSELYDIVENADGFAGVFPEHKHMVVNILQKRGYLVAMTGDGVNDAPSLKQADTGIAVEGATDAARSAADIVFLSPGLSAIIDAVKTSRRIFHRMYSYIVYRIALSLHLEIFLGSWIAIMGRSLNVDLLVFVAIFADIATLMVAYDRAPYSQSPVKWDLPRIWGMSIILGIILAAGTWIAYTTMMIHGQHGGIVQGHGNVDSVLFLQITLTQNWLILITRAKGSFWSSMPSRSLLGAVFTVDVIASLMCFFGVFVGQRTHWIAIVRIWVYSVGIFLVAAFVYAVIQGSKVFERLTTGDKKKIQECQRRHVEDQAVEMRSLSHNDSDRTL